MSGPLPSVIRRSDEVIQKKDLPAKACLGENDGYDRLRCEIDLTRLVALEPLNGLINVSMSG